jgi:hypothetical protein
LTFSLPGGCQHRRRAESLESGHILTRVEIMTTGECIEMATVQDNTRSSRTQRNTKNARIDQSVNL